MSPPSTRHPPAQPLAPVSSTSRPIVHVTRPSTDQTRQAPGEMDNTRLSADDFEDKEGERLKMDINRHEANVKSGILRRLRDLGIPSDDVRRKKSKKTTLSARYIQT